MLNRNRIFTSYYWQQGSFMAPFFRLIMLVDFAPIKKLHAAVRELSEDRAWFFAIDARIQEMIIEMNTVDQLFESGIDSLGRKLGDYAPFTVEEKQRKGQRYDHITLKDTGAFYDSWTVRVNRTGLILDADDASLYDEPLFEIYGVGVLGLTPENMFILRLAILENYKRYVRNVLLR